MGLVKLKEVLWGLSGIYGVIKYGLKYLWERLKN